MTIPTWIVMPAAFPTFRALVLALGALLLLCPAFAFADAPGVSEGEMRGLDRSFFAAPAAATVDTVVDDADERLKSGKRRCLRAVIGGNHNSAAADEGSMALPSALDPDKREVGRAMPPRWSVPAGATPDLPDRPPKIG